MRLFANFFRRREAPLRHRAARPVIDFDPPQPEVEVYVIGDLHGRADLLENLLGLIVEDCAERGTAKPHLVFVGDYIDRGDNSGKVLTRLMQLHDEAEGRVLCLLGNHERMMLDFIDTPNKGPRWLRNGGLQTVLSLGLGGVLADGMSEDELVALARDLHRALPDGVEDWLRSLPLSWNSGSVWVVHAGADPYVPMEEQSARTLLWGHRDFDLHPRRDGQWVVHGHTVVEVPVAQGGRISIDTGAIYTGHLTAARIGRGEVVFLTT